MGPDGRNISCMGRAWLSTLFLVEHGSNIFSRVEIGTYAATIFVQNLLFACILAHMKAKYLPTIPLPKLIATFYNARPMLHFARPMLRLWTVSVVTLRDLSCDFARPKLRLCAIHVATMSDPCCDFARLLLRFCATQVAMFRALYCDYARPILQLCATHVATLRDSCCDFGDPWLRLCATHF